MFPWKIVFWIIHLSEISVKLRRSAIPTYTISTSFQMFEVAEGFNCPPNVYNFNFFSNVRGCWRVQLPFFPWEDCLWDAWKCCFCLGELLKISPRLWKRLIFIQNHIFTLTNWLIFLICSNSFHNQPMSNQSYRNWSHPTLTYKVWGEISSNWEMETSPWHPWPRWLPSLTTRQFCRHSWKPSRGVSVQGWENTTS